jgi:branched-chain amino acid transport system permease protein
MPMTGAEFINSILSGLITAGLYIIIGLAIVVTFRATRVLNMAAGQYLVLGSYVFYTLEVEHRIPIVAALAVSLLLMALLGALTHWLLMRPVVGQPLFVPAIITLGISIVLTSVVDMVWGSQNRSLTSPIADSVYHLPVFRSGTISTYQIATVIAAVLMAGGFMVFQSHTRVGIQMRAAAEDPLLAGLSGIRVNTIYVLGWALGCIAATIGGLAFAYSSLLTPDSGSLGFTALAPVVLAGFDSIGGLVTGSILVGLIESFALLWLGGNAEDAAAFVVLLAIVLIRPAGLLRTAPGLRI